MPAPTRHEVAVKLKEIYAEMEYQRDGSLVSSGVSSVVSAFTLGYAQAQAMSIKTPKLDALANATTDAEIIAALKTLREDKEVAESTSLKNIVDIYDHAFQASQGLYAENTSPEIIATLTPAEAAQEAIDNLTATYNLQFAKVADRAEFLRMITLSLREQLKIEKQQALTALASQMTQEKRAAVDSARAEEKLAKNLAVEQTKANALIAKKLALYAADKIAKSEKENAVEAQHIIAIEEMTRLEAQYERESAAAAADAEHEQKRLYSLTASIEQENNEEVASHKKTTAELADLKQEVARLENLRFVAALEHTESDTAAKEKIGRLEEQLGLTKEELRFTKTMRDKFMQETKKLAEAGKGKDLAITDATHQAETLTVQLSEQEYVISKLEQELATAEEDIVESRTRSNDEARTSKQFRNENLRLTKENASLSTQKQSLEEELTVQQGIIALQQDLHREQEDRLNNTDFVKELKAEQAVNAHLKDAYGRAEVHINHLENELNSMKGTLKPTLDKNSELRRQVAELTAQVERMRMSTSASVYSHRLNQHKPHQQQHNQKQQAQHQNHQYTKLGK
jgi:hypothetical protein